jgi:hypothetical protein
MALLELNNEIATDGRWDRLGELTGRGKYDARGRVEMIWIDAISKTEDVRTAEEIDNLAGWFDYDRGSFAELMVKARLAERLPSDSKQMPGGENPTTILYRLPDVTVRMQWLVDLKKKRSEAGSEGGKKTSAKVKRGKDGRFHSESSKQMPGADQANAEQNEAKPAYPGPPPVSGSNPGSNSDADANARASAAAGAPASASADSSSGASARAEASAVSEARTSSNNEAGEGAGGGLDSSKQISGDPFLDDVFRSRGVGLAAFEAWVQAYRDPEWVKQEIREAIAWEATRPEGPMSIFPKFIARWLSNNWAEKSSQQESLPGLASPQINPQLERRIRTAIFEIDAALMEYGRSTVTRPEFFLGALAADIVRRRGGWIQIHDDRAKAKSLEDFRAPLRKIAEVIIEAEASLGVTA